jgi:Flp pilus assembly protein TadG
MRKLAKRWLRSRRATAGIEFALIAPVLILFTGGIVEFGRIALVYETVNRLATQYAIAWADCSDTPQGTCSTEISNYTAANAIANIAPQLQNPSVNLSLQMFQVQMSGTTPTVVYAYPSGASLSTSQTALAQATFTNGQSGVIVTAQYTHSLIYFQSLMTQFLSTKLTPTYTVAQLKS